MRDVKRGEFIRKIIKGKMGRKTYTRGAYCRYTKKFMAEDESDISHAVGIKGDTLVAIGFTY